MRRIFIEVPVLTKRWKELSFTKEDLRELQLLLLNDPESGSIMQGTGGIRKIRIRKGERGKSGGARVCYIDFKEYERLYLITVFSKKEKENLSKEERIILHDLVQKLKQSLRERKRYHEPAV